MNDISAVVPAESTSSPTHLELPPNLPFSEWEQLGVVLQTVQRSINWWVGDWLNYGERTYGEMYPQAVMEVTGWSYQRLADTKYVCNRLTPPVRRENLSWSHHLEVARGGFLDSGEQSWWLDLADRECLTTRELRERIQQQKLPSSSGYSPNGPVKSFEIEPYGDDGPVVYTLDEQGKMQPVSRLEPLMSSDSDEWGTPDWLFDILHAEFRFGLDVCAQPCNTKCDLFFDPEGDGLAQTWEGVCFMNPPYSEISQWMRKAHEEVQAGAIVVALIPARTDTNWWWDYARGYEVRFLKGRIRFLNPKGEEESSAPFPSAVIVMRRNIAPCVVWWQPQKG